MKLTQDQEKFLDDVVSSEWSLNTETGLVDVDGWVVIPDNYIKDWKFPVRFGEVTSNFSCSNNDLTSLEGSHHTVGWDFFAQGNRLNTLKGSPYKVGNEFYCPDKGLASLEGSPSIVGVISVYIYRANNQNITKLS